MSEEMINTKANTPEPQSVSQPQTVFETEPQPVPQPQTVFETEPQPVPQPQTVFKTEPQPKAVFEPKPQPAPKPEPQSAPETDVFENDFPEEPAEEQRPKRRFFRSRSSEADFSRDQWILSRIDDAHMMEYLTLEQRRFEQIQTAKEKRERRIFTAFRLLISLAAIVAVVYLLRDNPTVLVNILYIAGILAAIWFLKNPRDKEKDDKTD